LGPDDHLFGACPLPAGYVAVPLAAEDYIELLQVSWNAIGKEGIKLKRRVYDDKALSSYRRQHSGVTAKKGLWEVRYDPYDITRVWVRNHHDGGWIMVPWKHLRTSPVPFGETAWQASTWKTLIRNLSTDSGLTLSWGQRPFFGRSRGARSGGCDGR
jgi:hypothetical protein